MAMLCNPTPSLSKEGWDKLMSLADKPLSDKRKEAILRIKDRVNKGK